MPEGAELRHSRDRLRDLILGKTITSMSPSPVGRWREKNPEGLDEVQVSLPLKVDRVEVKGKFMWWELVNEESDQRWYMWCTYGMSGQWSSTRGKHVGFTVVTDSGEFHFNDQRRFGTLKFVPYRSEHVKKLNSLGPDMLGDDEVTPEIFARRLLKKPTMEIGDALLDQSLVSGVGNYVRAEALYRSGVSPMRCVVNLSPAEYLGLFEETRRVLKEAYESHGASIRTYRTVGGELGQQQFRFKIYEQKQCPRGHNTRKEAMPGGRTIHWCEQCQR